MQQGKLWLAALAIAATNVCAQAPLERGKYLVEGILTCGNCHTPPDLDAVVAYMQSVPPVSRKVAPPVYKVKHMTVDIPPGAAQPMPESEMKDPVKRDFYLATIGHCMECHTPMEKGHRDFRNALGTGGEKFEGPWGVTVARNITPHKEIGIGAWSDDEIKRAITKGLRRDGFKLRPPMGFDWYATMTDADLSAIVAYLRSIPAR